MNTIDDNKGIQKMEPRFSYERTVDPSRTEASGKIKYSGCFDLFMDIAAVHSAMMDAGYYELAADSKFWITAKTMVKIYRRPRMSQTAEITTWPENPEGLKCFRDYRLTEGDEVLAVGKTLWAVMDMKTGRLHKPEEVYPEGLVISDEKVLPEDFSHVKPGFAGEEFGRYTVKSTDIDVGRHMNNAAYLKAFASLYSSEKWKFLLKKFPEPLIEVQFKNQCFEGDELTFTQQFGDGDFRAEATLPDGKLAWQILIH